MKKITKKSIVLATALAVTVSGVLTGCGSGKTEGASATSDGIADTSANSDDVTKVTTIKAATGGSPRPYIYVDENDQPTGYDIEVLKEIFNRIPEYDLEIEVVERDAIFAGLTSGTYQVAVGNYSYNDERAASYLYSYPYDKVTYVFTYKTGGTKVASFEDAAGLTFEGTSGVSVTNAVEDWNEENPDKAININYTEADKATILQHVEDGVSSFDIVDGAMYIAYKEEYGYDIEASDVPEDELSLISKNLYAYFLLPKDGTELRDKIDEVLIELKDDGTLEKLSNEFFKANQVPEDDQFVNTPN
ncbi:MAG: transporter substrate-binding domain-containing protein [Lachnospiraceae bacterium]|nr:transporter substrate-binding domain-containing protein [Lachnospiraceae bacterium]